MAEFCKNCAPKYGMKPNEAPLLCEECGKDIEKTSFWNKIINRINGKNLLFHL